MQLLFFRWIPLLPFQITVLLTELSEELNQARQNVRRRIIKLDIQPVNEGDREYKTDPLEYDYQALIKLAEDFGVVLRTS